MELDLKDRLILHNQYRILEALYPKEAESHRHAQEALSYGFAKEFSRLVDHFSEPMSEEDCAEVLDVLDMFRQLDVSFDALVDKSGIDPKAIQFLGFDGNEESRQFVYAEHLWKTGRFVEAKAAGNSHAPFLARYRRMLKVWRDRPADFPMARETVLAIAAAARPG